MAALAVVGFGALTGACRVDVDVAIRADNGGGGSVRATAVLDANAVAQLGGETPEKRLALADLTKAGWKVEGPTPTEAKGLTVTASHDFADGAEAKALIDDLAGKDGPFQGFEVRQTASFAKTTTRLRGIVDLRKGLGAFTDPELREALAGPDGEPLGVDDAQLAKRFGTPPAEAFTLDVTVAVPGRDEATTRRARYGQQTVIEASSEQTNLRNLASVAVAITAALAVIVVLIESQRRRRRLDPAPPFDQDASSDP